jgi:hypothetical protein
MSSYLLNTARLPSAAVCNADMGMAQELLRQKAHSDY